MEGVTKKTRNLKIEKTNVWKNASQQKSYMLCFVTNSLNFIGILTDTEMGIQQLGNIQSGIEKYS